MQMIKQQVMRSLLPSPANGGTAGSPKPSLRSLAVCCTAAMGTPGQHAWAVQLQWPSPPPSMPFAACRAEFALRLMCHYRLWPGASLSRFGLFAGACLERLCICLTNCLKACKIALHKFTCQRASLSSSSSSDHVRCRLPREQLLTHVASCVRALFAVARCLPSHAARERREVSEALHAILVRTLYPEGYKPSLPSCQQQQPAGPGSMPAGNEEAGDGEGGSFGTNLMAEGMSTGATGEANGLSTVSSPPQVR